MSIRDGGENVRDRQPVVGQSDGDAKRAEKRARRGGNTAGFVRDADLASAEASLRAEVEAADAAALQAAIDANEALQEAFEAAGMADAAQGTADTALFEAQFGSIAVGRLNAGTINVALTLNAAVINSPVINAGPLTLDTNGISIATGTDTGNTIAWVGSGLTRGAIFTSLANRLFLQGANGVTLDAGGGTNTVIVTGGNFQAGNGAFSGSLSAAGSTVRTFENTSIPSGSRTTSDGNWTGAQSAGPDFTSNRNTSGYSTSDADVPSHNHRVPAHTHTVTI